MGSGSHCGGRPDRGWLLRLLRLQEVQRAEEEVKEGPGEERRRQEEEGRRSGRGGWRAEGTVQQSQRLWEKAIFKMVSVLANV